MRHTLSGWRCISAEPMRMKRRIEPESPLGRQVGVHLHVGDQEAIAEDLSVAFESEHRAHRRVRSVARDDVIAAQPIRAVGRLDGNDRRSRLTVRRRRPCASSASRGSAARARDRRAGLRRNTAAGSRTPAGDGPLPAAGRTRRRARRGRTPCRPSTTRPCSRSPRRSRADPRSRASASRSRSRASRSTACRRRRAAAPACRSARDRSPSVSPTGPPPTTITGRCATFGRMALRGRRVGQRELLIVDRHRLGAHARSASACHISWSRAAVQMRGSGCAVASSYARVTSNGRQ